MVIFNGKIGKSFINDMVIFNGKIGIHSIKFS